MVASEVTPWAKTGGLGDVLGALPEALEHLGHRVTTVMPKYRGSVVPSSEAAARPVRLGRSTHRVVLHAARLSAQRSVVFVDSPRHFDREHLYGPPGRADYPDSAERFGLLAAAALDVAEEQAAVERIDVLHAHDWQAGLLPALVRCDHRRWPRLSRSGIVFTIHNLAYQGLFARDAVPALGLPWDVFRLEAGEFWGQFSFLKAAINLSDIVTTVSPTYARETREPALGRGMDGVLRARGDRYVGILNGIDTVAWNPRTDPMLPAHYDAGDLSGKRACKQTVLARFNLPVGDDALARPLIGMVSRLVEQKGLDLVEEAADELTALDATWVFLGQGEARFESALRALASRHPSRVGVHIGFDEPLAHVVEAGADMFLMPSKFEPCGLNQMYSLRYGTVPIVHAVGGLEDTVRPFTPRARRANGFKFRGPTAANLVRTVRQAVRVFRNREAWTHLIRQGMSEDHSWDTSAREYVKVYRQARQFAAGGDPRNQNHRG